MSPLDLAQMLLRKASRDISAGELILAGREAYDMVCFHAQQAAEKSLKALLATDDIVYPKTHDLEALLKLTIPRVSQLSGVQDEVAALSQYAVVERYDDIVDPDEADARAALDSAKTVYDLASKLIHARES